MFQKIDGNEPVDRECEDTGVRAGQQKAGSLRDQSGGPYLSPGWASESLLLQPGWGAQKERPRILILLRLVKGSSFTEASNLPKAESEANRMNRWSGGGVQGVRSKASISHGAEWEERKEGPAQHPLGKETATHSSILAWKIPRAEEPGGSVESMGSRRVRHD